MTRTLILSAVTGILGAFVVLALGGMRSGRDWAHAGESQLTCGPTAANRTHVTLPFTPGDSLTITLPGTVRYRPGDKTEAVISGDAALVDHVRIENDTLSLDCDPSSSKLDIDLTGPAITNWKLTSSANLTLTGLSQGQLRLTMTGSGNVVATGAVETVGLKITGSGSAELKSLVTKSAEIKTTGSGGARLTAETSAGVSISGSGNVELFGHADLSRSKVTGSGRIMQVP